MRGSETLREKAGQFIDLLKPQDDDMELEEDLTDDDDDGPDPRDDLEGGPRKIRCASLDQMSTSESVQLVNHL